MDDATRVCAVLLREGAVPRASVPELDVPAVREDIERRLAATGLTLATSAYSDHVAVRLSADVLAYQDFDAASNFRLTDPECALLVVLWARLVLQKRTAAATRDVPGQDKLFSQDRQEASRNFQPQVRVEALLKEFGKAIGRDNIKRGVTRLRTFRFLAGRGSVIEAGPLLELGIDGVKMVEYVRREVLAKLELERQPPILESEDVDDVETRVLTVISDKGGTAAMGELSPALGVRPEKLRQVLKDLEADGRVVRSGNRRSTRYALARD